MLEIQSTPRRTLLNAILSAIFVFPVVAADAARAAEFCADMNALTQHARSNFLEGGINATALITPRPLPDAEKCMMTRSLAGGNVYHCAWKFLYRDVAANAAFDTYIQMMRDCFSEGAETVEDRGVNHPDSYHQRQFLVDNVVVSVSIKDKNALQETYVFVSVTGASSD